MIFTKVAWIAGLAVFAAMCWLAIIGFSPVVPLLITAIALFVLIGGGNLVNGRASPYGSRGGRPPRHRRPGRPRPVVSLYRDSGVVLRTYKMGEADRIVVLLTEHHGKVRAVAKGVRRTSSKFGARLEPLSHTALLMWRGRGELDIVNQVEVIDHFRVVREELTKMAQGLSMLEAVDQLAQEGQSDPQLYAMLVGALRALADPDLDPTLVPAAFFLKALVLEGASPMLDACASCGRSDTEVELVAFDLSEGGVLCRSCRRGRPMSEDALILLRRILGGELGATLREAPPVGAAELVQLATEAMESHLDRRLRTVHTANGL